MPAPIVSTHLSAMLSGPLADTFTCGTQTTGCLFDDMQQVIEDTTGFDVTRRHRVATIRTGTITGLVEDAAVSVTDSGSGTVTAYTVRKVLPVEDGLLQRVWLAVADT